ncbi:MULTISPECIES: heparan-alpha-glucosaminide N-acetyltransferase domain-containing protein [unclassified Stenotrophomonas]|uniref:acyltransferase family protein n=1 Tax=unclassified Stenotrophomonas TaxID=196198 RepID=UPI002117E963|nr:MULTISPECIES: heparan-alpha-glucosaminide N-acetyltransferase domain-containing protein [unclassified Stenotrophomonas]
MSAAAAPRMGSIDALRGLTVAAMLLVNNPGDWGHVYAPLLHADWHGFTPTDLIFPLFLFIAGVSMAFSLAPRAGQQTLRPALRSGLLQRALRIALAGALLHLLAWWLMDLPAYRLWGVLQRIALCVAVVGLLAIQTRARTQWAVLVGLLLAYTALLLGADSLAPWVNPASRLDTALFAPLLYKYDPLTGLGHDPEGLLSSLGAVATTVLGLRAGAWLRTGQVGGLAVLAAACLLLGGVAALWLPLNKQLWTPGFVLWTGGLSVTALLLAHLLVDRWGAPALGRRFGVNAIAAYLGSSAMALLLMAGGAWGWLYLALSTLLPTAPKLASLLCAVGFVAVWWGVVWALDARRIYLKI